MDFVQESHETNSDDGMRDCDSIDCDLNITRSRRLNTTTAATTRNTTTIGSNNNSNNNNKNSNGYIRNVGEMSFTGSTGIVGSMSGVAGAAGEGISSHSPVHQSELQMSHHHQFPPNHPLNALGNFMGISALHSIPSLPHNDMLEKLKMQVRDMKVGLMEQDYAAAAHAAAFGANVLNTPMNTAFTLPPTSMASFGHAAAAVQNMTAAVAAQSGGGNSGGAPTHNSNSSSQNLTNSNPSPAAMSASSLTNGGSGGGASGFSFTSPTAPNTKDASNSSASSEASNSSQQNNGWSFEEQYKQVRQWMAKKIKNPILFARLLRRLYEINDDPKRKEFLDDLFSFMQKKGTPINRLPIMAKSVLDLYELYNLVIARGGLVDVINKKLWQEIIKGLHLPSSITSAAFTLRTQYMKYLYTYECEKKNLSTTAELQAAIDGNRREGRRSSYGQYEAVHSQMHMSPMNRPTLPGSIQQMSPLALVTHAAAANNQQAQAAAAAAAAAHHRLMAPTFSGANLVAQELEQRMMEYFKLMQAKTEQQQQQLQQEQQQQRGSASRSSAGGGGSCGVGVGNNGGGSNVNGNSLHPALRQQQHQRQTSESPEIITRDALNALEMSRVALWQMYRNNTSPPVSVNTSPPGVVAGGGGGTVGSGGSGSTANGSNIEPQREALNLSDSPLGLSLSGIKREHERDPTPEPDNDEFDHRPPSAKRLGAALMPGFPGFYIPHNMAAAAAAAANFHHTNATHRNSEHEDNDDNGQHNTTMNPSAGDDNEHRQQHQQHQQQELNINHNHSPHHNLHHNLLNDGRNNHHNLHNLHLQTNTNNNHDKSDDSAIENSPSTSTSAGNGHISPVSSKKIHFSKPQKTGDCNEMNNRNVNGNCDTNRMMPNLLTAMDQNIGALEALSLLSTLQFRVKRKGADENGEQQLTVQLEFNGIKYSGVLKANNISYNGNGNANRHNIRSSNNDNNEVVRVMNSRENSITTITEDDEDEDENESVLSGTTRATATTPTVMALALTSSKTPDATQTQTATANYLSSTKNTENVENENKIDLDNDELKIEQNNDDIDDEEDDEEEIKINSDLVKTTTNSSVDKSAAGATAPTTATSMSTKSSTETEITTKTSAASGDTPTMLNTNPPANGVSSITNGPKSQPLKDGFSLS